MGVIKWAISGWLLPMIILWCGAGLLPCYSTYDGIRIVGESSSSSSTMDLLEKIMPEILILDMKMPGSDGISLINQIKQRYPELKIIILTVYDDDYV